MIAVTIFITISVWLKLDRWARERFLRHTVAIIGFSALLGIAASAYAQNIAAPAGGGGAGDQPDMSVPSPFEMPQYLWAHTLDGKPWGSTSGIDIGPHNEVWMIGRCGANNCDGSSVAPIYQMDMATGKPVKAIGAGMFVFPHGFAIDKEGNVYVSDAQTSKRNGSSLATTK